jgi:hypothetical protein
MHPLSSSPDRTLITLHMQACAAGCVDAASRQGQLQQYRIEPLLTLCRLTSLPMLTSLPVLPDASMTSMLRPVQVSTQRRSAHSAGQHTAQVSTQRRKGIGRRTARSDWSRSIVHETPSARHQLLQHAGHSRGGTQLEQIRQAYRQASIPSPKQP